MAEILHNIFNLNTLSGAGNIMELKKQNKKTESCLVILNIDAFSGRADELHNPVDKPSLSDLLGRIISNGNLLIIVSGDRKEKIDQQFGHLNCILIAENGAVCKKNDIWETNFSGNTFWKKNLEPLFEAVTQKCPKSFIEEKEYSLIWNYKAVEPITGILHAGQLKKTLENIIHFYNLKIMENTNTIEVMSMEIDRIKTIKNLVNTESLDSIFLMGENLSDADILEPLDKRTGQEIKSPTLHKANNLKDTLSLLEQLSL